MKMGNSFLWVCALIVIGIPINCLVIALSPSRELLPWLVWAGGALTAVLPCFVLGFLCGWHEREVRHG